MVSALRHLVVTGGNLMHETGTSPSEEVTGTAAANVGGVTLTNTMLSDEATAVGPLLRCSRISTCCPRETLSSPGVEDVKSWITHVLPSQPCEEIIPMNKGVKNTIWVLQVI